MLDTRTRNVIANFFSVDPADVKPEALAHIRWLYLVKIPGLGEKSMHAIKEWMGEHGYRYSRRYGWQHETTDAP